MLTSCRRFAFCLEMPGQILDGELHLLLVLLGEREAFPLLDRLAFEFGTFLLAVRHPSRQYREGGYRRFATAQQALATSVAEKPAGKTPTGTADRTSAGASSIGAPSGFKPTASTCRRR